MNSATEITNLLYRYNEYIDKGDLAGAAGMFKDAQLKLRGHDELQSGAQVLPMLQHFVIIYPDGTPKTKHIVTNPIIEIDEEGGKADTRSQYTVFQATEALPMQVIAAGAVTMIVLNGLRANGVSLTGIILCLIWRAISAAI